MTAFSNIIAEPQFLIMYAIAFILLYLGIKKKYEPLLLIPIAFVDKDRLPASYYFYGCGCSDGFWSDAS